jgi:Domain of unknown function (DUF4386)
MNTQSSNSGARVAGVSLVLAAIGFIAVFSILAKSFGYPDILDHPASDVLPRLYALGEYGRGVWAVYAGIPLLLIPAAAGAASFHDDAGRSVLRRVALVCAVLAAASMMLGLVRWPTLQWELARAWASASPGERTVLAATFDGANVMFGRYIGEFFGELFLNASFICFAAMAWTDRRLPRWVSGFGLFAGAVGLVAMWRNVTTVVGPFADVNNLLLPVWLVVWGVALVRAGVTAR